MTDKRLLQIFLDLISIDALSGSEKPVFEYAANFLKSCGYNPREDETAPLTGGNTGNLICDIGSGGDTVFLSHMDTARPTKNVKAIVTEDKITSDGTTVLGVDNRAGMASLLYAVEKAYKENIALKDFTLVFTTNEETTLGGSQNLKLPEKIKQGFIFDSHLPPGNFIDESVGAVAFNIKVKGKASHSGISPEKGIDSIKITSRAIASLEFGRIDEATTANIGSIHGGSAINVVPELTLIEGEVRSVNPDKIEKKISEIKIRFEKEAEKDGASVEFEYRWDFMPYTISRKSKVYQTLCDALISAGLEPQPQMSYGGSDANSLNAKGISCINLGIGAANPHSNDEYIYIADLYKTSDIALELMKK